MLKRIVFLVIIALLVPFGIKAAWVSLDKNKAANTPPEVTIISDDNNSTVLKINIYGFELKDQFQDGKTFQSLDLLTEVFSSVPGNPALPYISKVLAIPDQSGVSYEIVESGNIQTYKNINLLPSRKSWFEGEAETPYSENDEVYKSTELFPQSLVKLETPSVFRDFRITRLSLFPLRYSPAKNEIQVVSSFTIRIKYGAGEVVNPKTTAKKPIAPSYGNIYRSFISNYQSVLNNQYNGIENGHEVMLCIMPDSYVNSFLPYADWKRKSGIDVHITKFSDIGATASNPTIIKNHITDAYHNWADPPTYVLLIGDNGIFPIKIISYDYSFAYDDFFVEIDGNDFFPEMMVGRIPAQTDFQMQVMINKFMKYEKTPYIANTDWFKKGICCSNNEYLSQVDTKRFTANVMLQDGGFSSVDTLMSDGGFGGSGCSVDLSQVINSINSGRSYLNYRGEGWYDGWMANCYDFLVNDVSNLNNGEKLTFVTSIGCGVAMFTTNTGNCFGEEWLKLGTLTNPRGAVAFVGPTSNTHTAYNNHIDKGIYKGMFQEGMETPGEALLRGKINMYNVFGTDPWVEYQFRVFHILGDPSVHIWRDVPLAVNVTHPSTIPLGFSQPVFHVTFASTGLPVANAEVCLTGATLFSTGRTDSTGHVQLDINTSIVEQLSVVVRGKNVYPYLGNLTVVQGLEYISPEGYPLIMDISGNTDSLINPNENCNITFKLKNWGTQLSSNVHATLSVVDTNFAKVLTTNPISFGDLAVAASFVGNPFQFFVKPNCPVGQIITFNLHVTSNSGSWDYFYTQEVMGCRLDYVYCIVDDQGSTKVNYQLDPGETAKLYISILNNGEDIAPNVKGVLKSIDPYITILDSTAQFGSLLIDSTAMNLGDHFLIVVDPSCPTKHQAAFTLKLNTQNGNYAYQKILSFNLPVAIPTISDFTGPDAYGYYAYCSNDTIFDQSPVYNWVELYPSGTLLPTGTGNLTSTINLPFPFKYYGTVYNQVRISTDGWIAFGSGTQTASMNYPLPHSDNVNCMVAGYWDDLFSPWGSIGKIYYTSDLLHNRFIIEWREVEQNNSTYPEPTETFEIILLDPAHYSTPTGDGEIIVQYNSIQSSSSNTVGIENDLQNVGLQYVFNDVYDSTAAELESAFAVKFTTHPPSISVGINNPPINNQLVSNNCLDQNIPNPFNTHTSIGFTIKEACMVKLAVYDSRGALIKTLVNGVKSSGHHAVAWNGTSDNGNTLSPGIYFYQLQTANGVESKKMFILK